MASTLKKGQSVFIPFVGDASVLDSQNRPRMYKSVEQFKKIYPLFRLEQPELVEYAPVVHAEWDKDERCTACKEKSTEGLDAEKWNYWLPPYCPHCGAKMI